VGVDVVETLVPPRTRKALRATGQVCGLVFCLAMLVASALYTHEAWALGWRTSGVWQIPQWMPAVPLPLGFALLSLQYVAELLQPDPRSGP
jgi:TRAP-type C4-dicarboxylate transport system permease small subunit